MRTLLQNPFSLVLPALLSFAIMDGTAQNFDWEFKDANQTEGWTLAGAISNGISNGVWKLTATQGNPRIFTPKLQIDAGRWKIVKFRMRLGNGVHTNGHLQFITEKQPQWDNQTLTPFTCQADGKWHNCVVDMSDNPLWNGKITQLLFQPFALPWRPPQGQRIVELERFELINMELETGLYGFQDKPTSASPMAVSIDSRNRLSARYIRIESRIDLEFVELEAYNANKTNVALKKPVRVSTPIWGDGSPGNDGNITDGGHSPIVQMRDPGINWWEVDLGKEIPLTHVVIYMREYRMTGGYRSLNGASFSVIDHEKNAVASCQLEVGASDDKITIPMDEAYFLQRDLSTRFGFKAIPPRNIFAGPQGSLSLVVPKAETMAKGVVTLYDLEGRVLQKLNLTRGTENYALPLPGKGHYKITATATYDGDLVLSKETSAAVIGKPLDDHRRLKSIFGVQGKGRVLTELGAAWSWAQIMTHQVSKSGSGYEWTPQFALRIKNGKLDLSPDVNWVIMFTYLPEFLQSVPRSQRGNSPTSPPHDYEEFIRFIEWAISAIPDFAKYVAPIGEPSHSFKGSPEELARYHEVIARTVRAVRPDMRIIGPMMSPGNKASIESIKELDQLGMFAHLDGISINPYVVTPFRSKMPEADFIEFVDEVIRHFASTGRPDYPVYLTEFGFGTEAGELTQARYSSRAALLLATRPTIKLANFFLLGGDGWGYSYFNSRGAPRPVYTAMAHVFRWLSGCSSGVSTKLTPTLYLAAFKKDEGERLAIWDLESESVLKVPLHAIDRIQDMIGRNIVGSEGRLSITQSPLFLDLSGDSLLPCLSSATSAPDIKLTPGQSADIGPFEDVFLPAAFFHRGQTITAALNIDLGEYRILGKTRGAWRMISIAVSAPPEKTAR